MNAFEFVSIFKNPETQKEVQFGKVDPGYVTGRPSVIYDTDIISGTLSKPLPYIESYTPSPNDRVMIVKGVIIGKII
jgi:hypothetical protein